MIGAASGEAGLTREVAEFITGTSYAAISENVIALGKKSILDGLGLALSGSVAKSGELVRRHLAQLALGAGPSSIIGTNLRVVVVANHMRPSVVCTADCGEERDPLKVCGQAIQHTEGLDFHFTGI